LAGIRIDTMELAEVSTRLRQANRDAIAAQRALTSRIAAYLRAGGPYPTDAEFAHVQSLQLRASELLDEVLRLTGARLPSRSAPLSWRARRVAPDLSEAAQMLHEGRDGTA
jgi:hypothetical protein